MRFLRLAAVLVALGGCSYASGAHSAPPIDVLVVSKHLETTRARLYCTTGEYLGVVRGLEVTGRTARARVGLRSCSTVQVVVEGLGQLRYPLEAPIQIGPGCTVAIRVAHHLPFSEWRVVC